MLLAKNRRLEDFGLEDKGIWNGAFSFIHMSDCQLGYFDENCSFHKDLQRLEQAIEEVALLQPAFLVMGGDMTHASPGQDAYLEQVQAYKKAIEKLNIPCFHVAGNHDLLDEPTDFSLAEYEKHFGETYYSFWYDGVYCVVLNTAIIKSAEKSAARFEEQYHWLVEDLAKNALFSPKHIFVFMHHPCFLFDSLEMDHQFNLPKSSRFSILELFSEVKVSAVFAGHYHRNARAEYLSVDLIVTSAVGKPHGDDPSGFRYIELEETGYTDYYLKLEDNYV